MEFNKYRLKELAEYKNERIPTNQLTTSNYISTENLLPNKQGKQNANNLPNSKTVKKYIENDILISNIRPYFKKIWQADNVGGTSNDVLNITSNNKNISNNYLYYYLSQDKFFQYMNQTSKGTKMPRGDKEAIMEFEIQVPRNIKHQNFISDLGKSLDNKIAYNTKIIANLEELSQTLFKHWFIDFEFSDENGNPYKSSGGEMIDSELGEIPLNWFIKSIDEVADCQNGYAFYKTGYSDSGYFVMDLGNININSQYVTTNKDKYINKKDIDQKKEKFLLKTNDLVMVMTDRTQEMNILGRTVRITKPDYFVLNQRMFRIRVYNKYLLTYLQSLLNSEYTRQQFLSKSLGSAQKYINTKHITKHKIVIPNTRLIKKYYSQCENMILQSIELSEENSKLFQLRDTLLPKLMSGEIEIPDDIEVDTDELSI
ncbi:hypothetical protein F9280_09345 [Staphylococcus sp. B2-b]|uniref:restriction endonuclease subunit S n=2 Tax=Staphylococcus TaxID=1279 RepID=UPI001261AD48|nr:restriction endonuclease subunit S [Staphylococcus sp. B2-b]KAB7644688.1 hypothetical protein F9280_09345 [Staphylococcus sp. B2-b]